ncbi:hypothetical protein H1R20_g6223, partial [Candolleomyces eurysporus]
MVLEAKDNKVISAKFNGERAQQWLLQPDPSGKCKVALASLVDGQYVQLQQDQAKMGRSPFYWEIVENGDTYRLGEGQNKLALPLSSGDACKIKTIASDSQEEDESITLFVFEDTPEVRGALRLGTKGQLGDSELSVSYTDGQAGQIRIHNHLDSTIYAAVSAPVGADESFAQWAVKPDTWERWSRSADESVHVSLGDGCIGAQTAKIVRGETGKVLHIHSLPSNPKWEGIKSVAPTDAKYIENGVERTHHIGVKNNLGFDIHASVLTSLQGSGDTRQWNMKPGITEFWSRQGPEVVLVSVGSALGVPRAFVGKVGFTLQINDL